MNTDTSFTVFLVSCMLLLAIIGFSVGQAYQPEVTCLVTVDNSVQYQARSVPKVDVEANIASFRVGVNAAKVKVPFRELKIEIVSK